MWQRTMSHLIQYVHNSPKCRRTGGAGTTVPCPLLATLARSLELASFRVPEHSVEPYTKSASSACLKPRCLPYSRRRFDYRSVATFHASAYGRNEWPLLAARRNSRMTAFVPMTGINRSRVADGVLGKRTMKVGRRQGSADRRAPAVRSTLTA